LYVTAKNELGLSESIVEKIQREKTKQNPSITPEDFEIFRDPHLTKSHGRLIDISDLTDNGLVKANVISKLEDMFGEDASKYQVVDALLWELYVRKRSLLNDPGNPQVKIIESSSEMFIVGGKKRT
jgi:hypothetical protein